MSGFIVSNQKRRTLQRASPPSATRKESVRSRSLANTHTLARACVVPISRTNLVARSEHNLSPRVADRHARTRWPLRATFDDRRRSPVGFRDRVACAHVLPGAECPLGDADHCGELRVSVPLFRLRWFLNAGGRRSLAEAQPFGKALHCAKARDPRKCAM